jgi:DNA adenine methylase
MPPALSKSIAAKPFVKWAGGKSQLIPEIAIALAQILPADRPFTYVEPFVGGGAVLFYIFAYFPKVERVIINDINPNLIAAYKVIRENPNILIEGLSEIEKDYYRLRTDEERKLFFLRKRKEFNATTENSIEKQVLFIFLNKTCFNGLYRVNSRGLFNVPFGGYVKPLICDRNNILAVHQYLQKTEILLGDFEQTLAYARENTIFYIDPPYKPIRTTSAFTSYTKENFTDSDQKKLKFFCDNIHAKGARFILSNSDVKNFDKDNDFFDCLYSDYSIRRIRAKRNINSKGEGRGKISELLISN